MSCACQHVAALPEPVYEGCATDENWPTFDAAILQDRVAHEGPQVPQWIQPGQAAQFRSQDEPALFVFQPSAFDAGSADGDTTCPQYRPAGRSGLQVNHLPRCPAMVFDIHFSSDGLPAYRVLTTRQSVRVPAVWKSWAGTRVSVLLYAAQLADNEIVSAVGQSDSREVLVAP
jgi:hypothetical protein